MSICGPHTGAEEEMSQWAIANTHAHTQGGIGAVVAAMGRHIENPDVQDTACRALGTLAIIPENQAKIGAQVENIHECI
jgi:hypothetical protein